MHCVCIYMLVSLCLCVCAYVCVALPHEPIHSLAGSVFGLCVCYFLVLIPFRCSVHPFSKSSVVEMAPQCRSTCSTWASKPTVLTGDRWSRSHQVRLPGISKLSSTSCLEKSRPKCMRCSRPARWAEESYGWAAVDKVGYGLDAGDYLSDGTTSG